MKVAILGSSGQIGAYLTEYLRKKGHEVIEFDKTNNSTQDLTRTSEERRMLAFKNANIPAQPVDSIVSVSGSSSGLLVEQYTDLSGNIRGNYVLEKDYNPETGGSPFGYDKIRFISNAKEVIAEGLMKKAEF